MFETSEIQVEPMDFHSFPCNNSLKKKYLDSPCTPGNPNCIYSTPCRRERVRIKKIINLHFKRHLDYEIIFYNGRSYRSVCRQLLDLNRKQVFCFEKIKNKASSSYLHPSETLKCSAVAFCKSIKNTVKVCGTPVDA